MTDQVNTVVEGMQKIPAIDKNVSDIVKSVSDLITLQKNQMELNKSQAELQAEFVKEKEEMKASIEKSVVEKYEAKFQEQANQIEGLTKSLKKPAYVHTGGFDPVEAEMEIIKSYSNVVLQGKARGLLENKEYVEKSLACIKHFAKENPTSSAKSLIESVDIEKAIHNTQDSELGGILANTPVFLGIQRELVRISPMRSLANVIATTQSSTAEIVIVDSYGEAEFMLEGQDYPKTTAAKINNKTIKSTRIGFAAQITDTVLKQGFTNNRYGINLVNVISQVSAEQITKKADISFISGATKSGNGVMEGLIPETAKLQEYNFADINGNLQYVRDKVLFVKSGDNASFAYDAIIDLISSLEASPSNVLMFNSRTKAHIEKFKTQVGGNQYLFNYDSGNGARDGLLSGRINGIPFVINERMPNIAQNTFPVFYGDVRRAFTIIDFFGSSFLQREPDGVSTIHNFVSDNFISSMRTGTQYYRLLKIIA